VLDGHQTRTGATTATMSSFTPNPSRTARRTGLPGKPRDLIEGEKLADVPSHCRFVDRLTPVDASHAVERKFLHHLDTREERDAGSSSHADDCLAGCAITVLAADGVGQDSRIEQVLVVHGRRSVNVCSSSATVSPHSRGASSWLRSASPSSRCAAASRERPARSRRSSIDSRTTAATLRPVA